MLRLTNTLLVVLWTVIGSSRLVTATNEAGEKWLETKRNDAHVQKRPSGLMYRRMNGGEGTLHPTFDTYVKIDMEISRILDDEGNTEIVETTTLGEPRMVRPMDTIPGLREALGLMVEGDWWEVYLPSDLGFVDKSNTKVYGDEALLVSLELVSIASGDTLPKGEHHDCYMELSWNQQSGHYGYRPMDGCDSKDHGYINKVSGWDGRSMKAEQELTRLRSVEKKGNTKESLANWLRRRIHILKQFLMEEMRICSIFGVHTPNGVLFLQEDCNAQEQEYSGKAQDWGEDKMREELNRLDGLDQASVDPVLGSWIRRRIRILKQMNAAKSAFAEQQRQNAEQKSQSSQQEEQQQSAEVKDEL